MTKTITVDCRHIDSSGVGVYIRECLPYFLKSNNNFVLLGDAKKLLPIAVNKENVKIVECNIKPFSVKELFLFPAKILKIINSTDVYYTPFFNIPHNIKIPIFTTIHDIIFPDMPYLTSKTGLFVRMLFYKYAAKRSTAIFTVSNFSKERILHYLGKEKRVIVTYSAAGSFVLDYSKNNILQKENNIVFIGNIKKHKGLSVLLEAFNNAKKEGLDYKLTIVGSKDDFRTKDDKVLQALKFSDEADDKADSKTNDIEFTGYVSNEKLCALIENAALLVQPSLYEGFCLPPLQAMSLGTEVLISDIPVLKEIYLDFPVTFFKAGDTESLKNNILALLKNKKPKSILLDKNLLCRYTFDKTAAVILSELT
jgi:glycosyltransferase involved in cell wall biosynthesis